MPNSNYRAGRAFEYKVRKQWEKRGYTVLRTAGSHGPVDLIAIQGDDIAFVQCKRCQTMAQANRLRATLIGRTPLERSRAYTQWLEVYVAERRTQYTWDLHEL